MQNYSTLLVIALMVVVFYFLIMRPQKKRQQALQKTLNELTPGTRVVLSSGLFGTIISIGSRQAVLELSPGVELTVLKQAIARVALDTDEETFDDDEDDDESLAADVHDDALPEPSMPVEPTTTPVEPATPVQHVPVTEPSLVEPERRPAASS